MNRRFRYPRNLFFMNGWYENQWWEGNEEEQADLLRKYNCSVSQRKSLLPFTLATSTVMVQDYSAVADNGYVRKIFVVMTGSYHPLYCFHRLEMKSNQPMKNTSTLHFQKFISFSVMMGFGH